MTKLSAYLKRKGFKSVEENAAWANSKRAANIAKWNEIRKKE